MLVVVIQKRDYLGGWPGDINSVPEVSKKRQPADLKGLENVESECGERDQ